MYIIKALDAVSLFVYRLLIGIISIIDVKILVTRVVAPIVQVVTNVRVSVTVATVVTSCPAAVV